MGVGLKYGLNQPSSIHWLSSIIFPCCLSCFNESHPTFAETAFRVLSECFRRTKVSLPSHNLFCNYWYGQFEVLTTSKAQLHQNYPFLRNCKNNVFVAKICKYTFYERAEGFFCAARKPANPCARLLWSSIVSIAQNWPTDFCMVLLVYTIGHQLL